MEWMQGIGKRMYSDTSFRHLIRKAMVIGALVVCVCTLIWPAAGPARGAGRDRPALSPLDPAAGRPTPGSAAQPGPTPGPVGASVPSQSSTCPPQSVSAPAGWPLVMCDTFDNDDNGWSVDLVNDKKGRVERTIADGVYNWALQVRTPLLNSSGPTLDALGDFYVAVDARLVSGSEVDGEYGLVFRSHVDSGSLYLFQVADARGFMLWHKSGDQVERAIDWTPTPAIRRNDWNRLGVRAVGRNLMFYVNDQPVAQASDEEVLKGQLEVSVQVNSPGKLAIQFDNFEVRAAPPDAALTPVIGLPSATEAAIPNCAPKSKVAPADWTVLMCDPFENDAGGWFQGTIPYEGGTVGRRISGGTYTWDMDVTGDTMFDSEGCGLGPLSDFYAAVDVRSTAGPEADIQYGMAFRWRGSNEYYLFLVSETKGFMMWRNAYRMMQAAINWTPTSAIRPGDWNRVGLLAVGPTLTFYINDQPVGQVTDEALEDGDLRLAVMDMTHGRAVVDFDNCEVRRAPASAKLTPIPTLTPTPVPTVGVEACPPSPPSAPADWPIALCDTFDDNHNKWRTGARTDSLGKTSHKLAGSYVLEFEALERMLWFEDLASPEVSTFYVSVEAKRQSKSDKTGYGLLFRMVDTDNYFAVLVYDNSRKFEVMSDVKGHRRALIEPAQSAAIQPGGMNRIAVKGEGRHFTIFINDQPVAELDDIHFKQGRVGVVLAVERGDQGQVEFDNFELRTAPQQ